MEFTISDKELSVRTALAVPPTQPKNGLFQLEKREIEILNVTLNTWAVKKLGEKNQKIKR